MSEPLADRFRRTLLALLLVSVPAMSSAAPRGEALTRVPSMKQLRTEERALQFQIEHEKRVLRQESPVATPASGRHAATEPRQAAGASTQIAAEKQLLEQQVAAEASRLHQGQQALRHQREIQNIWVGAIRAKIQKNWTIPKGYQLGQSCQVTVKQDRRGYILSLHVGRCTANGLFRRSLTQAIVRSQPFPRAPNSHVFNAILNFTFN